MPASIRTSGGSYIVTLADDLTDRPAGFQDFVIVHGLLHLRIPNHGRLFKALMSVHVPAWKAEDIIRSTRKTRRSRRVSRSRTD